MADRATFLHITDAHVSASGVPFERDDRKVDVSGITAGTREGALDLLFGRLAERLTREGRTLDGVFFSGDAQSKGATGGHELVFKLIADHLGIATDRIVSVPGNHDVPRDADPGSAKRYENFVRVWGASGCVVPWLDRHATDDALTLNLGHRMGAGHARLNAYPIIVEFTCKKFGLQGTGEW